MLVICEPPRKEKQSYFNFAYEDLWKTRNTDNITEQDSADAHTQKKQNETKIKKGKGKGKGNA